MDCEGGDMKAYNIARQLIEEGEDDRHKAYQDTVGKWTIGRGRNLQDKGISQPESDLLFANDLEEAFAVCKSEFGFFKDLSPVRQAVIVDLFHNLGL